MDEISKISIPDLPEATRINLTDNILINDGTSSKKTTIKGLFDSIDKFEEDYDYSPKAYFQEIKTKESYLTDNITISEIKFESVENSYGGLTAMIDC